MTRPTVKLPFQVFLRQHRQMLTWSLPLQLLIFSRQESVKLYQLAAIQGNASAQLNLGICLAAGIGVKTDLIEAYKWLTLAANQGEANAMQVIEHFLKEVSPEQIAEGKRRAESFQPKVNPASSIK
jgi:TPR repeat protein